jgi:transcriptional regulator with XRE-family HTH domain
LLRLTQDEVAERMRSLGHSTWSRATVSEIERYGRSLSVDELVSLAAVFSIGVSSMLDPLGPGLPGLDSRGQMDFGGPRPIPPFTAMHWVRDEIYISLTPEGSDIDWGTTGEGNVAETRKEVTEELEEFGRRLPRAKRKSRRKDSAT